jgi:hypothetical protein
MHATILYLQRPANRKAAPTARAAFSSDLYYLIAE